VLTADDPVGAVTWRDAELYAEWRTRQARANGQPFRYRLPTVDQWLRAARGADRRRFVHGDVFRPRWVKGWHSHEFPVHSAVLSFPVDESPYGVFDLNGNQAEWCRDRGWHQADGSRLLKGGASVDRQVSSFWLTNQRVHGTMGPLLGMGFRLVAERVP
jgi:formylglycine-generating enzyme required for sulfatase activity